MKIECPYCEGNSNCAWCYGTGKMKTKYKLIKKLGKQQDKDFMDDALLGL